MVKPAATMLVLRTQQDWQLPRAVKESIILFTKWKSKLT